MQEMARECLSAVSGELAHAKNRMHGKIAELDMLHVKRNKLVGMNFLVI
jgi:hypothetical protein